MKNIVIVYSDKSLKDRVEAKYKNQDCTAYTVNMQEVDLIDWLIFQYDEAIIIYDEESMEVKFEDIINAKVYHYLPAEKVAQGDF